MEWLNLFRNKDDEKSKEINIQTIGANSYEVYFVHVYRPLVRACC